jgi:hypothetical protein
MDLTGKRHSTYLTVVYIKKKNDIKLVTSKSRKPEDLVEAFFICLAFLKKHHVKSRTVRMDNKRRYRPCSLPCYHHQLILPSRRGRTCMAGRTTSTGTSSHCRALSSSHTTSTAPPGHLTAWMVFTSGQSRKDTGCSRFTYQEPDISAPRTPCRNTLETRSNCPHVCLAHTIILVARAIQALHPDDITCNNANEYRHAAQETEDLSKQLTAIVRSPDKATSVSTADTPVHTLAPVITTEPQHKVAEPPLEEHKEQ